MQLIKPGTKIDFVGKRKFAAVVSLVLVICSIVLFIKPGPTWGIDFTGGTEVQLDFEGDAEISDIRGALRDLGLGDDAVQQINAPEDGEFIVRVQDPTFGTEGVEEAVTAGLVAKFGPDWIAESEFDAQIGARMTVRYTGSPVALSDIEAAVAGVEDADVRDSPDDNTFYVALPGLASNIKELLAESLPGKTFKVVRVDSVGPKVGDELRTQGFVSILSTLALILVYVAFRFDLTFAPGAVLALFHDVTLVVGMFVALDALGIAKNEFNLPMIGALLTIIGYSLNDTIVIYDRIRENMSRYRRRDTASLINTSINETLARTLATSMTTLMAMTAFLIFGGPVIRTFALAIFLGVIVGTYSTVFVASPTILLMEDVRPFLSKLVAPLAGTASVEAKGEAAKAEESAEVSATERRRRDRAARQAARAATGDTAVGESSES